jgi:hypothetical protein
VHAEPGGDRGYRRIHGELADLGIAVAAADRTDLAAIPALAGRGDPDARLLRRGLLDEQHEEYDKILEFAEDSAKFVPVAGEGADEDLDPAKDALGLLALVKRSLSRERLSGTSTPFIDDRPVPSLKAKIRALTRRTSQLDPRHVVTRLNQAMHGWASYFRHAVANNAFGMLDNFAGGE